MTPRPRDISGEFRPHPATDTPAGSTPARGCPAAKRGRGWPAGAVAVLVVTAAALVAFLGTAGVAATLRSMATTPTVTATTCVATRTAYALATSPAAAVATFSTVATARGLGAATPAPARAQLTGPTPTQPSPPSPTPPPTPAPSGQTPGQGGSGATTSSEDRGPLGGLMDDAGDWIARNVVLSGLDPMLSMLGNTLLSTPDPARVPAVVDLWQTSRTIAVSLYGLLVMASFFIAGAFETLQNRYTPRQMLPRLLVGFVAVHLSLWLIGQATALANAVATALLGQLDARAAADSMRVIIRNALDAEGVWLIFVVAAFVVLLAGLLIGYVVRLALLSLITVTAPLALACHALPQTEPLARQWWRALGALLLAQAGQALTLALSLRLFFAPGVVPFGMAPAEARAMMPFLLLAAMWIMVKLPFWALSQAQGGGRGGSLLGSVVKTWMAVKTLGVVKAAATAGRDRGWRINGPRLSHDPRYPGRHRGRGGRRGGGGAGGRGGPGPRGPRVGPRPAGPSDRPGPTVSPAGGAATPRRPVPVLRTSAPAPPGQRPAGPGKPATRPPGHPAGPTRPAGTQAGPAPRAGDRAPAATARTWHEVAMRQREQHQAQQRQAQQRGTAATPGPSGPAGSAAPAGRPPGHPRPGRAGHRPPPTAPASGATARPRTRPTDTRRPDARR